MNPRYPTEFRDLDKCNTSAGIAKLNKIVVLANEALSKAKTIRLSYDKRKNAVKGALPGTNQNPKVMEEIDFLQKEYEVVVKRDDVTIFSTDVTLVNVDESGSKEPIHSAS